MQRRFDKPVCRRRISFAENASKHMKYPGRLVIDEVDVKMEKRSPAPYRYTEPVP